MDTKAFRKLLKQIKFPGGAGSQVTDGFGGPRATWRKQHGHAGSNTLANLSNAARAAGFTYTDGVVSTDAVGEHVNRGNVFSKTLADGTIVTVSMHSYYGQTAWENSFSASVTVKVPADQG